MEEDRPRLPPRLVAARVARMHGRWDEVAEIEEALAATRRSWFTVFSEDLDAG